MSHFISRCEHGTVGAQCRCPAKDKEVRIIPCPDYCASRVTQQPMSTERYLEKLKDERDMFERRSEALAAQLREKTEENAAKYEEIESIRHSYALLEAERQRLYDQLATASAEVKTLRDVLETGLKMYESYGLIAGHVEGDAFAPGRWVNSVRDVLKSVKSSL